MKTNACIARMILAAMAAGALFMGIVRADPAPPASANASPDILSQKYLLGDFDKKRSALEDEGVVFTPNYSAEVFGNPSGGVKQGVVYSGLLDLELTLDFKKMAGWDGSFHVSSYYPMGNSLSNGDTNELLTVSNITSYNTPLLFELWYEQHLFDDKLSLRIGQLAADSEFFISTTAANFLNSTYGWPGVMTRSSPAPSYPYAGTGVRLRLDPDEHWTFLTGVFTGDPAPDRIGDPNPNRAPDHQFDNSGTDFILNSSDGVFSISEIWYKLNQEKDAHGLPGTYRVGGWLHTGTFSSLDNDADGLPLADPASDGRPTAVDGNHGFYFVGDQALWQDKSNPNQTREIDLFLEAGSALGDRSTFDYSVQGGVLFQGLIPGRPGDFFGLAAAYGHIGSGAQDRISDQAIFDGKGQATPDYEQNIEVTYLAQIAPWWTVQPDLQVIPHPGGSAAIPNALVLGCRTVINF